MEIPSTLQEETRQDIKTVCFVGAGQMGAFNSLLAASAGYTVHVYDNSTESLQSLSDRQHGIAAYLHHEGVLDREQSISAIQRIRHFSDLAEAVADADLLSESIPEQLELKQSLLSECDRICPSKTILTTNTSSLLVSELEGSVSKDRQFAALHSYLGSLLFDIVGSSGSTPGTIETLERYVQSLRGVSIVHLHEVRGYLVNFLFGALNSGALSLAAEGTATVEEVDRAWIAFQDAKSGPFGVMDFVGLDVVLDVTVSQVPHRMFPGNSEKVIEFLKTYIAAGKLGVKSGEGFYRYPSPSYQSPEFIHENQPDRNLYITLFNRLLSAALLLVIRGDTTAQHVDLAWTTVTRSPMGPFTTLRQQWHEIALDEIFTQIVKLPPEGIFNMVKENLQKLL